MTETRLAIVERVFARIMRLFGERAKPVAVNEPQPPVSLRADAEPATVQADPVLELLAAIEETALSIYGAHGLPTRLGQYARSPRGSHWKFVAEVLTTEERWELFLANSDRGGWRFARLEDLVSAESAPSADLVKAAALLNACHTIRSRLSNPATASRPDDIGSAIRLGADWRSLETALDRSRTGSLKLSRPSRSRARRSDKKLS